MRVKRRNPYDVHPFFILTGLDKSCATWDKR